MTAPTETQVRAMRDQLYDNPSTDANWDGCKDNWMKPEEIRWLQERCAAQALKTQGGRT